MKRIILILITCFCLSCETSSAQIMDTAQAMKHTVKTADFLLKRARTQKAIAWTLLGVGVGTAALTSIIIRNSDPLRVLENIASDKGSFGGVFIIAGGALMVSSVPLFIASGRNRRNAQLMIRKENTGFSMPAILKMNNWSVGIRIDL